MDENTNTPPEGPAEGQPLPPADQPDAITADPASSDFYVAPADGSESGHAVYDVDLGQFVSGVMSKADAGKAKSTLAKGDDITSGHTLEVRAV